MKSHYSVVIVLSSLLSGLLPCEPAKGHVFDYSCLLGMQQTSENQHRHARCPPWKKVHILGGSPHSPSAAFSFLIFKGLYLWLLSTVFQRELVVHHSRHQLETASWLNLPKTNISYSCPHSTCLTLLCTNLTPSPGPLQCGISQALLLSPHALFSHLDCRSRVFLILLLLADGPTLSFSLETNSGHNVPFQL